MPIPQNRKVAEWRTIQAGVAQHDRERIRPARHERDDSSVRWGTAGAGTCCRGGSWAGYRSRCSGSESFLGLRRWSSVPRSRSSFSPFRWPRMNILKKPAGASSMRSISSSPVKSGAGTTFQRRAAFSGPLVLVKLYSLTEVLGMFPEGARPTEKRLRSLARRTRRVSPLRPRAILHRRRRDEAPRRDAPMLRLKREGGSPIWYIRGTVARVAIHESTRTTDRRQAEAYLHRRQAEIYAASALGHHPSGSWSEAVNSYLDHGKPGRFLRPLVEQWGDLPLDRIDQREVDRVAAGPLPRGIDCDARPATIHAGQGGAPARRGAWESKALCRSA